VAHRFERPQSSGNEPSNALDWRAAVGHERALPSVGCLQVRLGAVDA